KKERPGNRTPAAQRLPLARQRENAVLDVQLDFRQWKIGVLDVLAYQHLAGQVVVAFEGGRAVLDGQHPDLELAEPLIASRRGLIGRDGIDEPVRAALVGQIVNALGVKQTREMAKPLLRAGKLR